ncbi:MAG TPA: M64 family metallopeptidase [Bacteroidales bacterium]|nr:M64 family metallopeptidase [Bacteroidales bacterium]
MKKIILLFLLALTIGAQAQFKDHFKNKTLRIDYMHSGSAPVEYYMFDTLFIEKYWGGSKTNLIDAFDYGNYKFEVYDAETNELIYSRGYSSLFREYQSTEEGKSSCKSFDETIVFPYPKHKVNISFYSRKADLSWSKEFILQVDPKTRDIQKNGQKKFKTSKVHYSGNPNKKLDIVIIAEGYTAADMDKFEQDCDRFRDYILESEPYIQNKDKINIWAVRSVSEESGTDLPGEDIWKNTVVNTNFYTFGSERYLTTEDMKSVRDVAANAPYDQIFILVNHEKYGGGGIYNFYSLGTSDNPAGDFLFQHEFGHAFAGLGDEYYTSDVAVEDFYPLDVEPWEPNITTMVHFTAKWANMVSQDTPVPTPATEGYLNKVGVYEGGGYVAKGVYRPYIDCTMKSVRYDAFCPVCLRAIQRMIDFYAE